MARVHRLPWRVLAGTLLALAGLALGWLWFRDSAFATVERVTITGSGSSEQAQVREALTTAASGMSTLRVDNESLDEAVEPFSSVARLRIRPDFPHELRIEVIEHEPVATVASGASSVPATGGGLLLDGVRADDLPVVASSAPLTDGRVRDRRALAALTVAGAAPPELRARSERLYYGPAGMTLDLRDGPELIFGSAGEARSKWLAAARVLAEPSSAGATYLDLRVPKLVAAGGVGPVEPEPTATPVPGQAVVPSNPQP
ncbi:MAG: cell division protein FtsQ/DivIB [Solirubrobacteraceae bacterium]